MFHRKMKRQIVHYGRGLPADAKQEWINANRLKEQGQYTEAAAIFERLAAAAQKRGLTDRTPRLLLDAAYAWLQAGESNHGAALLKQGLSLLHSQRQWKALRRTGESAADEMERLGYPQAAQDLRAWLEPILANLPPVVEAPEMDATRSPRQGFRLAVKCPSCGASLRSDEANWVDENHVECPHCGSTVPL